MSDPRLDTNPYATPRANVLRPENGATRLGRLTAQLLMLLALYAAVAALAAVSETVYLRRLLSGGSDEGTGELTPLDIIQMVVGGLQFVVYIATAIWFLRWVHRANRAVRHLGAAGLRYTPGWAVGWYFLPIVNLWKPYQAMREIWRASRNAPAWANQPSSPLLGWWWFLWVVSSSLGQASFRIALSADTAQELIFASGVTLASDVVDIPLCALAYLLIRRIDAMQNRQFEALPTQT